MDVREILVAAVKAVEDAEVPDDLRAPAFTKAIDLIVGISSSHHSGARTVDNQSSLQKSTRSQQPSDSAIGRIASRLELDESLVSEVYDNSDGELQIIISRNRLARGKAAATKQIALLVAAGRQGSGIEEWTTTAVIRDYAERFGRENKNFSRDLERMSDSFSFRGQGSDRLVKLRQPGWVNATEQIRSLLGVNSGDN